MINIRFIRKFENPIFYLIKFCSENDHRFEWRAANQHGSPNSAFSFTRATVPWPGGCSSPILTSWVCSGVSINGGYPNSWMIKINGNSISEMIRAQPPKIRTPPKIAEITVALCMTGSTTFDSNHEPRHVWPKLGRQGLQELHSPGTVDQFLQSYAYENWTGHTKKHWNMICTM